MKHLRFRERFGEKLNPESPLFRKSFDIEVLEDVRKNVSPLSLSSHLKDVSKYLERAGLRTVDHVNRANRKEIKLTHGFRKFYTKQLLDSGLNTEKRWMLEGHDLLGNDPHYVRCSALIFLEYQKGINLLTIDSANRLRNKVEELQEEQDEISLMKLSHKKEMDEMREQMKTKFTQIISMIQENPKLAKVKTSALTNKKL